ncbi:MAG: single-stranded DNA-binding protein [SAR202 cluster bacterium]|nr:single-stranded DNA-binding protein [SAR202 cluster bacterium]|tara:strand:+ start:1502 stop:1930 length:429 start_codon:yes stop_codon:yes gene_type:complete
MAGLNKIILIGRLGNDPEMRYTPNGSAVSSFSMAVSRSYNVADGERREETEWFRVTAWNRTAEAVNQFLSKGREVYVEGRLSTSEWQDREGKQRFTLEVNAQTVQFLGGRDEAQSDRGMDDVGMPPAGDGPEQNDLDDDIPF